MWTTTTYLDAHCLVTQIWIGRKLGSAKRSVTPVYEIIRRQYNMLLRTGLRVYRKQWLETLGDMVQNRSQWPKCTHLSSLTFILSILQTYPFFWNQLFHCFIFLIIIDTSTFATLVFLVLMSSRFTDIVWQFVPGLHRLTSSQWVFR